MALAAFPANLLELGTVMWLKPITATNCDPLTKVKGNRNRHKNSIIESNYLKKKLMSLWKI